MNYLSSVVKVLRTSLFSISLLCFTVLLLIPQQYLTEEVFNWWDKAQHSLAFAILTVTGFWSHPKHATAIFILLLVYGGVIEVLQSLLGWRHGDIQDWLADAIGVLVCYALRRIGIHVFMTAENPGRNT